MSQSFSLLSFRLFYTYVSSCKYLQLNVFWNVFILNHLTCRLDSDGFVDHFSLTEMSYFLHVVEMRQSMPIKVKYVLDLKRSCPLPHSLLVCCVWSTLSSNVSGLKAVFAEMRHSAQEQHVAFAEIFNRVAFLQSFIMSETHTFSSLFYNALGFVASFLLTSVRRTAGARWVWTWLASAVLLE